MLAPSTHERQGAGWMQLAQEGFNRRTRDAIDHELFLAAVQELNLSCNAANTTVYGNTMGLLDGQGRATATFNFPSGYAYFAGSSFHHAFGVIGSGGNVAFVSEPASLLMY